MPYDYLVESIDKFYNQEEFSKKLIDKGFINVEHRNLTNGIAAIHTWLENRIMIKRLIQLIKIARKLASSGALGYN